MAGGVGSRFWPVSTKSNPKQFHDMLGTGDTLIQKTFYRLIKLIPHENVFILTNERYKDLVHEQLPILEDRQVVLEPDMRNTAPCILYASMKIQKENPDAVMVVAPSDHWIEDEVQFNQNLKQAFDYCTQNEALVTLGIPPTFPNTGYGYIEYDKQSRQSIKSVKNFVEKPDYNTAKSYLEKGNYLWNAGIFIWTSRNIIEAFKKYQEEMYNLFVEGIKVFNTEFEDDFVRDNYGKAENISIDYAIMEKSNTVFVLPAEFDWNDLGTWGSLYNKLEKDENSNALVNSRVLAEDSSGNMISSKKNKIVVLDGIKDYIIVDEDEVLLIFPKEKEQDIKTILQKVKDKFGEKYI